MKINANELRVGNWIEIYETPPQFPEEKGLWRCNGMTIHLIESENDIKAKGILLTEEILLKCGFKWSIYHQAHSNDADNFDYVIDICKDFCRVIKYRRNWDVLIHIQYLHQLQNIYFALTNEELQVEL